MLLKNEFTFQKKSKIKAGEGKKEGLYPFFTSSDTKLLFLDDYLFDEEAIILGTGGMPSCNYYKGKFAVSTDNFVLKSNGNIFPKYLYYFLRNNNLSILKDGFYGAGLKHIGKEYIENIDIPSIAKGEQTKIINELDTIVKLINTRSVQINKLEELVKSRFIEMFTPFENQTKSMDDICSICRGASPRPISAYVTDNYDGVNWIKIGDVGEDDIYITHTKEKITEVGALKSRRVKPGDFILSNSMSFGRPYILGING